MVPNIKSPARYALYAVLVIAALYAGTKIYSALTAKKPEQCEHAAAPTAGAAVTLDLSAEQVAFVKIEKVGTATFVELRQAFGNIDYNQNLLVQVFTSCAGRIIEAYPNVGDKIENGDKLFTIDSPDLLAAESNLIAAAGVLKLQNVTLLRQQKMKSFGGASQQAVDQSTSDQQTAEGALRSARDAVRIFGKTEEEVEEIIRKRMADDQTLIIKSLVEGCVAARNAAPGLFLQPGTAPPSSSSTSAPPPLGVYTIADLETMWMFANVVETDAPLMRVGQIVSAHVPAYPDREFEGRITALGQHIDPNGRWLSVRTEVKDPEHLLRAGMLGNFTVFVGQPHKATAVPYNAVVREGDGTMTVWTAEDNEHIVRRDVRIGKAQKGFDEILEGLRQGESIVTDNAVFLSNQYAIVQNPTD